MCEMKQKKKKKKQALRQSKCGKNKTFHKELKITQTFFALPFL